MTTGRPSTTSVRFDADVHEALRETADEAGVSLNWLINRACREFLQHVELPITADGDEGKDAAARPVRPKDTVRGRQRGRQPQPDPTVTPAVFDRATAARYLGLSLSTLAQMTAAGEIPSIAIGRTVTGQAGRRVYRPADLDRWLDARGEGGTP